MMYRLSVLVVFLMLVNSAPALAQNPSCIFTMQAPFTFNANCVGLPDITHSADITHDVLVGRVVRGVIDVDMGHRQCLQMEVDVRKAQGWVLNFGNSPSNDGFGGDAADFEHDSEFEIFVPGPTPGPPGGPLPLPGFQTPGALNVYTNDLDPAGPARLILKIPNFYSGRMNKFNFEVGHKLLCASSRRLFGRRITAIAILRDNFIFNIDPTVPDSESSTGFNDTVYHIGFNRVVRPGSNRVGTGVRKITIRLLEEDCECAEEIGP